MGWNKSPACLCTTTETVSNVVQTWIEAKAKQPKHLMEDFTALVEPARLQSTIGPAHQMSVVYLDGFLLAAVEDKTGTLLQRIA
jgi:hypothetical protein